MTFLIVFLMILEFNVLLIYFYFYDEKNILRISAHNRLVFCC